MRCVSLIQGVFLPGSAVLCMSILRHATFAWWELTAFMTLAAVCVYHTLCRHATIVAAGAWSGPLLTALTGAAYDRLLSPRRGHLLEVAPPKGMPPIKTGIMEMSYAKVRTA